MATYNRTFSNINLGISVNGEHVFGELTTTNIPVVHNTFPSAPLRRMSYGHGNFGTRIYGKPEKWNDRESSIQLSGSNIDVQVGTTNGSVLGTIRSDVEKSIIESIEFTVDQRGCADFVLTLNKLPAFPIEPFSTVSFFLGNSLQPAYTGIIDYPEENGAGYEKYTFKGFGFRKILDRNTFEVIFESGYDIGEIVYQIAANYVSVSTPINFNSSKINTVTGVFNATTNDLAKNKISKALDTYAIMTGHTWGVDSAGDFFFMPRETDIVKTLVSGYHFDAFKPKLNLNEVSNSIVVQRSEGKGSGGNGWSVAGVYANNTSIVKFGLREKYYKIPGSFGDDDADLIGNALIAELAEPKYSADVEGMVLVDANDIPPFGYYRIINPYGDYTEILQECDNISDWTLTNKDGDTVIELSDIVLASGIGSLKIEWNVAPSNDGTGDGGILGDLHMGEGMLASVNNLVGDYDTVVSNVNLIGNPVTIRMFVRASKTGNVINFGFGENSWLENIQTISVNVTNRFFVYELDVSDLNINKISQIGFQPIEPDGATVYIDRVEVLARGNRHYILELNKWTAKINPREGSMIDAEFGPVPPKMYDFVSQALALAEENKFTGEIR